MGQKQYDKAKYFYLLWSSEVQSKPDEPKPGTGTKKQIKLKPEPDKPKTKARSQKPEPGVNPVNN